MSRRAGAPSPEHTLQREIGVLTEPSSTLGTTETAALTFQRDGTNVRGRRLNCSKT
jgi:hypothetical protein